MHWTGVIVGRSSAKRVFRILPTFVGKARFSYFTDVCHTYRCNEPPRLFSEWGAHGGREGGR